MTKYFGAKMEERLPELEWAARQREEERYNAAFSAYEREQTNNAMVANAIKSRPFGSGYGDDRQQMIDDFEQMVRDSKNPIPVDRSALVEQSRQDRLKISGGIATRRADLQRDFGGGNGLKGGEGGAFVGLVEMTRRLQGAIGRADPVVSELKTNNVLTKNLLDQGKKQVEVMESMKGFGALA